MRTDTRRRILDVQNFDRMFNGDSCLILNKIDFTKAGYAERLATSVFSRTSDITFVASCECHYLTGNEFIGSTCPKCHSIVTRDMDAADGHLHHKTWLSCPEGVPGGWLNPAVYQVLNRWMTYSKRRSSYLADILDPTTPIPPELEGHVTGKGFSYFYQNFDYLMDFFLNVNKATAFKQETARIRTFIQEFRDRLFCHYLPTMSSSLHSIVMSEGTNSNRRRFVDKNAQFVLHAAETLSYLEHSPRRVRRQAQIETATWQAYQDYIKYIDDISYRQLSIKKSLPRQHIFGSRLHFTFRGVIVPIAGEHWYDELHLPYSMAVNLYRVDIMGILMHQYGMCVSEAARKHHKALVTFDPLIYQIIQTLIAECSLYKGVPCLFNRNPTIRRGSTQLLFHTHTKTVVEDKSIGFSSMICGPPNADYDGDELNGLRLTEIGAVEHWLSMHPSRNMLSLNELGVDDCITIPKPMLTVWNSFLGMC